MQHVESGYCPPAVFRLSYRPHLGNNSLALNESAVEGLAIYDVAIVGAGPAGATLARLIGNQFRVLLIEKRQLDYGAQDECGGKCCGGLLAPDAQKMLSRLGLGLPKWVLVEPQLFVVRAIDVPRWIERYYQRFYINLDRQQFDCWLASLVPDCVERRFGYRLLSCQAAEGHFRLVMAGQGGNLVEQARIVVGADGAFSLLRRQALPPSAHPKTYFAIQQWVESIDPQPYFSALFDPEISDYYCWTIPKGDLLVVGAALAPGDKTAGKFERYMQKLASFGFRLGKPVRREGAFLLRPNSQRCLTTDSNGIALVGEAGGWISPSSAEGLSYALRSGLILAEVLRAGLEGFERRYRRAIRSLRWNLFLKQGKARLIFSPLGRSIAMRSGLMSVQVLRALAVPPAASPPGP